MPVHPRVCGERLESVVAELADHGSSPRVRGTALVDLAVLLGARFIPACAGNGSPLSDDMRVVPVHPRVCGERQSDPAFRIPRSGSSPRVRGTVFPGGFLVSGERFIPACAGNGREPPSRPSRPTVHPRVCGERLPLDDDVSQVDGSSPRVRGTELQVQGLTEDGRFIPACAGNGQHREPHRHQPPVHPRVCGERAMATSIPCLTAGSSPRVRGTDALVHQVLTRLRFIPACAGNGSWRDIGCCDGPVHPRVCGERSGSSGSVTARCGSSPRVRGTDGPPVATCCATRFIPACAGNGCSYGSSPLCGERHSRCQSPRRSAGSSPRVRGTALAVVLALYC